MNASLVAFLAASIVAVLAVVWALMERRRAAAAETKAWDLHARHAETEARMRLFEDQAAASTELLRVQAAQSASTAANTVAEALLKRTDETFRTRELMSQQRMEAQLKPVAETLKQFQEHVAALERRGIEWLSVVGASRHALVVEVGEGRRPWIPSLLEWVIYVRFFMWPR